MSKDYELIQLDNGIRVAFKPMAHSHIVHCGFILDVGSRDERPGQEGIAHFWEHMVFKGTQKRNAYQIINRLESVGGELNAYTTKEKICFYASVLKPFFPKAIELLTDITFHSTFPQKQLEIERGVILEEMSLYEDSPEDNLQDTFDELLFAGHSLGNNILGTRESVKGFSRELLQTFIADNLKTGAMVFSIVGDLSIEKVRYFANKYLAELPIMNGERKRILFDSYKPLTKTIAKPISQSHCAIGGMAYPVMHDKQISLFMLTNLLGGPAMNSRLNLALRERRGLVYSIEAGYQPYSDTGSMGIFFATDQGQIRKAVKLVMHEISLLQSKALGTMQLHRAKAQIKGQLAMAEENENAVMLAMGKAILERGDLINLEEIFEKIDAITAAELMEVANEVFDQDKLSILIFEPEE
jgi:predicted Zn-dependent peptidase